ncbi:hypothetical protein YC2023_075117 [Brassica napus]
MTTCSGGSEHCPHRSFAQPSWSKKSDRNQKYVDDNSPETINSISLNELGDLLLDMEFVPNKAYKIMGSAHLKGGSLGNPRPLLSINKEPTSFEKVLGLYFGLSSISLYFQREKHLSTCFHLSTCDPLL